AALQSVAGLRIDQLDFSVAQTEAAEDAVGLGCERLRGGTVEVLLREEIVAAPDVRKVRVQVRDAVARRLLHLRSAVCDAGDEVEAALELSHRRPPPGPRAAPARRCPAGTGAPRSSPPRREASSRRAAAGRGGPSSSRTSR